MIVLFVIGGVSGVMTASTPVDWQLTQTYFVVAHLHYVLIGINVFPVAGAVYYWFPKMTGRLLDERLGQWNFWTMFVGFNLGFFPMHLVGMMGMPRRVYTYGSGMGWTSMNLAISLGSLLFAVGVLLLFVNIAVSLRRGRIAGSDPWGAPTLEWSIPSPPPPYNFAVIPTIESRHPLWERWLDETPARSNLAEGLLLDHGRETIGTTPLDAEPNLILEMPADSLAPFVLTCGLTLGMIGALFHAWWLSGLGGAVLAGALIDWFWPRRVHADMDKADG
jgi:heme/copper-type cytochrome/quinol oxidase subunit 1